MNIEAYKVIFEQSTELLVVIDTNFTILNASDAYLKTTKTHKETIVGQHFFTVFPNNPNDTTADGESNIRASFNRVLENKISDTINVVKYDIPKPETEGGGFEVKYWQPCHTPVLDAFNNVKYIIQSVKDVTENEGLIAELELEKTELKKVEDSEKRYNMMLMKSPFAFAVLKGKNMVVTLANDSVKEMWGKGKDLEGKPLLEVLPEIKNSEFPELLNNVYKTGIPFYGEELLAPVFRNGKLEDVYFNFVYQPYLEANETISGVTVIAYEVTASVIVKKALAAQREAEQKALKSIEESNNRYYTMLMESPFAFSVMKGKDMVITLANDLMKEFWGKGKDVEGKTLLQLLPELKDQPFPEMIEKVYTTGIPVSANEILGKLTYNGQLNHKYFNVVFQPYYEADNSISGVTQIAYEVTEMILARKKIETSEARFKSIVMQTPVAIGIYKGKKYITEIANEHCLQMLNKGVDFVGKPLFDILPELETQGFKGLMDKVLESGTTYYGNELAFNIHKNNITTQGFYNFIIQQLRADDESVTGIVVVANEVTEQVLARKKVEESDKRYNMMLMHSPFTFAVLKGKNMVITLANDRVKAIWGKGNDVVGKSMLEIMPELINTPFPALLDEVIATGIPYHGREVQNPHNIHGHEKEEYFNFVYQPYLEADGTISGITIIGYDVTEQVIAKRKIEESELRFQAAVAAVQGIIWTNNAKGEMETEQAGWAELTGQSYEQYRGYGWINTIHPDDAEATLIAWNESVKQVKNFVFEHRVKMKNGSWGRFSINAIPLINANGQITEWVGVHTNITEQRQLQDAVKASEKHFRLMADLMPTKISSADADGNLIYLNKQWLDFTGLNFEDQKEKGYPQIVHPEDLALFEFEFRNAFKNGTNLELEMRFENKDGEHIWHLNIVSPIKDENGKITMWLSSATDIHVQKTKIEKIKERETMFRQLVAQAPVAICVLRGKDYVIEVINSGMAEMWHKKEVDVINKPAFEVLPELIEQGFKILLDNVSETGERLVVQELPITLNRNGHPADIFVKFVYEPLFEDDGSISGVMALAHDITELVVARKKMEVQTALFEDMLMTSPGFVCTFSGPEHVHELVNEQYQSLFGKRKIQGKPIMIALPELEGQGFDKLLDHVYTTGETYVGIDIPATMARDEGLAPELRYFNFSYQPMYNEFKEIYSILLFGHEVTEQVVAKNRNLETKEIRAKELEEKVQQRTNELNEANTVLQEKNDELALQNDEKEKKAAELIVANKELAFLSGEKEKKSVELIIANKKLAYQSSEKEKRAAELILINKELESFTYISSHDLQEPLRKIQTFAQRILEKEYAALSENGKDYFRRMQNAANRMQTLIEDLLSYSHTNVSDRKFEKTNLTKIVEEVNIELSEMILEKNAILEIGELHELTINPSQFRQLINNLITNSLKFSRPNVQPHIKITSSTVTGSQFQEQNQDLPIGKFSANLIYYHLRFIDNGIGFEPEYKNKIFELFQRLHGKEDYAGTGIGLAIVKKIVDNHNGIITASSELDRGATFDIYIPFG